MIQFMSILASPQKKKKKKRDSKKENYGIKYSYNGIQLILKITLGNRIAKVMNNL